MMPTWRRYLRWLPSPSPGTPLTPQPFAPWATARASMRSFEGNQLRVQDLHRVFQNNDLTLRGFREYPMSGQSLGTHGRQSVGIQGCSYGYPNLLALSQFNLGW